MAITCEIVTDLEPVWQSVRSMGIELDIEPHGSIKDTGAYIEALKDADGALISINPLTTREVMQACPKLKAVSRLGVGVDSIDTQAATELGVMVCNVPGENTVEVAEHAIALLLAIVRQLPQSIEAVRAGAWGNNIKVFNQLKVSVDRVAGKTVGILGFGNIGKAFAVRIRGFGPRRVISHDKYVSQAHADALGVEMVSMDKLLAESDFITIHAPHTPETDKIINAQTLSKMKENAILINCARGSLVDEEALTEALKNKTIAYAGLDVTAKEPISPNSPLLSLPNAFITPHFAGYSPTFMQECGRKQAENITRVLTGNTPHGLANPKVLTVVTGMRSTGQKWAGIPEF